MAPGGLDGSLLCHSGRQLCAVGCVSSVGSCLVHATHSVPRHVDPRLPNALMSDAQGTARRVNETHKMSVFSGKS